MQTFKHVDAIEFFEWVEAFDGDAKLAELYWAPGRSPMLARAQHEAFLDGQKDLIWLAEISQKLENSRAFRAVTG